MKTVGLIIKTKKGGKPSKQDEPKQEKSKE